MADASTKCANKLAESSQKLAKEAMTMNQKYMEQQQEAAKNMMNCRTMNDWADMQSKWMQQSVDQMVSNMSKLSEMSIKMTTEAFQPMNDQWSKAAKKASDAMAA